MNQSDSSINTKRYLRETDILDFKSPSIRELINEKSWNKLNTFNKILSIYNFVRDDIKFGYNKNDNISASEVLIDGYGQCNTKANLFMALLRGVGVPNRIHGFTINKELQKGAITGLWYKLAPQSILHSWVEVYHEGQWYNMEGIILDKKYINSLQVKFKDCKTNLCGYGMYTENFRNPQVDWKLNNTYIQEKGINNDFGLFDSPDDFYEKHQQDLGLFKRLVYENVVRHIMNKNVNMIRELY